MFVKTENLNEVKRSAALREKLKVTKEKRAIEEKLRYNNQTLVSRGTLIVLPFLFAGFNVFFFVRKTKGVADSDSEDESAADWVVKHQKFMKEKEKAQQTVHILILNIYCYFFI